MLRDAGQLVGERVDDPIELGVHTGCVGLVVDAVQQGFHQPQDAFGVMAIRFAG